MNTEVNSSDSEATFENVPVLVDKENLNPLAEQALEKLVDIDNPGVVVGDTPARTVLEQARAQKAAEANSLREDRIARLQGYESSEDVRRAA